MSYRIRRHADPDAFLERAGDWLLRSEAENNLILALAEKLIEGTQESEGPPYLATVEDSEGGVAGCVFRTPPWKPILSRLPVGAVEALVEDLSQVYGGLPAVLGAEPEVGSFARSWARLRGVRARPGMEQRVHELTRVEDTPDPPGGARWARDGDCERLAEWMEAFGKEAGMGPRDPEGAARQLVAERSMAVWEDDQEVVSMAARTGRTPTGARVGWVYTPLERRGRGYGTGVTAWLTRRLLESGLRSCYLYTDLANPISNRIYRRIGYRPVVDVREYVFESREKGDPAAGGS